MLGQVSDYMSSKLGAVVARGVLIASISFIAPAAAAEVSGKVMAAGKPIEGSTVALFAAGDGSKKLAESKTAADGTFTLNAADASGNLLYIVAEGGNGNDAIALMATLGAEPPATVVVNELTTIASVWTGAQFLSGTSMSGNALGLKIAAGNVRNFVDLQTGGLGPVIQDAINSARTPTLANFSTLATLLSGCITKVTDSACEQLFAAATPPDGSAPKNTLEAAEAVARNPAYKPERLFALLDVFYPVPAGKQLRRTPFMPYLTFPPSAWILPLKFTGGGLSGPGKIAFDAEGRAWTGANFIVGSQGADALWDGNLALFAPDGKPLSPMTTGFTGGGLQGPGFGTAITKDGKVWVTSTSGQTISLFDRDGKPLSPDEGYNFDGKLGHMQGVIVAPNSDVWILDAGHNQIVHFPGGDPSKGAILCTTPDNKPGQPPCHLERPFHLAIDQQDRIWATNAMTNTVTRFSASDPTKFDVLQVGFSPKAIAIDSQGNAWVSNTAGDSYPINLPVKARMAEAWLAGHRDESTMTRIVVQSLANNPRGSVTMLKPDGTQAPGSPFHADGSIVGPWGISVDGNDHIWVANFFGRSVVQLCGVRTETCPPGMKTGDPISPPGGYVGGGIEMLTDVSIDPAGNVWVADNWYQWESCFGHPPEAESTLCGGTGLTVIYGLAKPVAIPIFGPPRAP